MQSERVYELPVSNIAYHVYLVEDDAEHLHHVSQQAFRRTLDTYSEYEALAERFQVELERREAVFKEQREQEKLRRQQERSSGKHASHHHHHYHNSHHHHQRLRTRDSHEHLPFSTSTSSSVARGRGRSAQLAAISAEAAAAAEAALAQPRSSTSSRSRHTSPISVNGHNGNRRQLPHAPLSSSHQQLTHIRSSSSDRSFSASPALPLTPSPRLAPMNASDGATTGFTNQHRHHQQQQDNVHSNKDASSDDGKDSRGELPSTPTSDGTVSLRTQRKKRKQTIPISQSIVSRIPGITLRLQPEKQGDALQVEIIKNVDDYGPLPAPPNSSSLVTHHSPSTHQDIRRGSPTLVAVATPPSPAITPTETDSMQQQQKRLEGDQPAVDTNSEDEMMADAQAGEVPTQTAATLAEGTTTSTTTTAMETDLAEQRDDHVVRAEDLRKVRESIESGRRRAYSFLQQAVDAYQDPDVDEDDLSSYVQYRRRSTVGSRTKGLHSASTASLQLNQNTMLLAADPYATLLPSAAGSYLPLSWENFSARDCVVNKVVGKHDKDLDELEEVVQDVITRQQQYHQQLWEEQRSHSGGSETPQQQSEHASGTHGSRQSSPHQHAGKREKHEHQYAPLTMTTRSHGSAGTRHRRTPSSQTGRNATSPTRDTDTFVSTATAASSSSKTAATSRSSRHRDSATVSTRRGAQNDTLLHYDDIERILTEKRRKKRIEKMRQSSKASSGNGDDDEHEDETMRDVRQMSVDSDSTAVTKDEPTAMAVDDDSRSVSKDSVPSKRAMSFSGSSASRDESDSVAGPSFKRERRNSSTVHMRNGHATTTTNGQTGKSKQPSDRTGTPTPSSSEAEDETDLDYKGKGRRPSQSQPHTAPILSSDGDALRPTSPTVETSTARRRARSSATLPLLEMAGTGGSKDTRAVEANFFDAALEMMNKKRRDVLAKRKAAKLAEEAEAEAALKAAEAERDEKLHAAEDEKQRQAEQEKRLEELRAQKIESSNLPKTSKMLPGRVRRRPPRGVDETGYLPDACTSCQLSLTELDKTSWKVAQDEKSIQLPKTWGAHAVLCSACRLQYSIHHTRCTQCFYVPVQEELAASPRCLRCRSGTWLKELLIPTVPGANLMKIPVARPSKKSDQSTSVSRRSSIVGEGAAVEEDTADKAGDEGHPPAHD